MFTQKREQHLHLFMQCIRIYICAMCSGASALALGTLNQNMIHSINSDALNQSGLQCPVLHPWPDTPEHLVAQGGIVTQDERSGWADLSL